MTTAYPSDHVIEISAKITDTTLDQCDFTCTLFVQPNKCITVSKNNCKPVANDKNAYRLAFNTLPLGRGPVKMVMNIQIPDVTFDDGVRNINTTPICTGVNDQ